MIICYVFWTAFLDCDDFEFRNIALFIDWFYTMHGVENCFSLFDQVIVWGLLIIPVTDHVYNHYFK